MSDLCRIFMIVHCIANCIKMMAICAFVQRAGVEAAKEKDQYRSIDGQQHEYYQYKFQKNELADLNLHFDSYLRTGDKQHLERLFSILDKQKEGKIDRYEMKEGLQAMYKRNMDFTETDQIWDQMSPDNSSYVTKEEFVSYFEKQRITNVD